MALTKLTSVISQLRRARWYAYALAVLATIATVGLRSVLAPWINDRPTLILFALPIALSAYGGGLGPGLVCTVLVTLAAEFFVVAPTYSFAIAQPEDGAQLVLLFVVGVLLSAMNARLPRWQGAAEQPSDRKFVAAARKVQGGFAFALACLIAISGVSYFSLLRLADNARMVAHTREVLDRLGELANSSIDDEGMRRAFIATGDESFLRPYLTELQSSRRDVAALSELTSDNPGEGARLAQIIQLLDAQQRLNTEIVAAQGHGDAAAARRLVSVEAVRLDGSLGKLLAEMRAAEERLLARRESDTHASTSFGRTIIVVGGVLALLLVGWALLAIRRDFVRRLRAEAELARFFSLSLDFLCISSVDGYFKRVSPAVTTILGWSIEEFLSQPYMYFIHPDDHAATLREVERQMQTGEGVLSFENRYRAKDGSWRVLSWRSSPQPDGLMYATARDVTDIKAAEQALREAKITLEDRVKERTVELARANEALGRSERRFRALIERSSDCIALLDAEGTFLQLSPAVTAVEGYTPQELLGRSCFEHVHPDDLPQLQAALHELARKPGESIPLLGRRRHKNGAWIYLEGVMTNLLEDPAVQAIVGNYRDVTRRKQIESGLQEQLARLALLSRITRAIDERQDIGSVYTVVLSALEEQLPCDFACVLAYDEASASFSVARVGTRSTALGTRLPVAAQWHAQHTDGMAACVRGELFYATDLVGPAPALLAELGQLGLRALVAAPLSIEGKAFGVLLAARCAAQSFGEGEREFLRQLSEHVALAAHQAQLYGALQTAYDDLRHSQQAVMQQERLRVLGQMASGIAHDINNSISPVTIYTKLLERERGLSEQSREYLRVIRQCVRDISDTVGRMREFYRPADPAQAFVPVQLNTLLPELVHLTRARWSDMPQERGTVVRMQLEMAANLPAARGIESEIREALTNLIFNAVDAMPNGGTITLRTAAGAPSDSGERTVDVEVIDTGLGMDAETRRRCLEPFFTTKGERGSGLGLAMVYGIAQRHGGNIAIDSALGRGTTVRLTFPVAAGSAPNGATAEEPIVVPPLRILIVDDDPVVLKSMRAMLEADGHSVVAMDAGQKAIEAFALAIGSARFDVVITDLGMPHMDGRQVAAAVKAASPSTPVIMLTGWGRLMGEAEIPQHVDRLLSKPPRIRELQSALASLVRAPLERLAGC